MFKKVVSLALAVSVLFSLTACGNKQKTRYEAEFLQLFDTVTQIVAYTDNKEEFTKYSQLIYDNLKEYHQLYDIYHDYEGINNLKTINDNAGIKPVKVDKRIIDLLLFAKEWNQNTNGTMSVAFGAVLKIWHEHRTQGIEDEENATLPSMEELKEASKHTDINKMIIDEANSTVFLEDPKMSLDVGAVGKGYATEQVSRIAMKNGFKSGLISVGGNVRAVGSKGTGNQFWNVGIKNPDEESSQVNLRVVNLNNCSLVSSGDYERYYIVNGEEYNHIVDPATLFPAEKFRQVTIVCTDSGMADALSTTLFILPVEKGLELIRSLPDTEAMWVMKDGEVVYSDHFEKYLKK